MKTAFPVVRILSCAALLFAAGAVTSACSPVIELPGATYCGVGGHPICVALLIEEPEKRIVETRQAIRDTLFSKDPAARRQASVLLSSLAYGADLYPFLDLIESSGLESDDRSWISAAADQIALRRAPRQLRIKLLSAAIRSGGATTPHGDPLYRPFALYLAARGGLEEFQPAIARYLAALEPERVRKRDLQKILPFFELCGGSPSFDDGPRVAFQRLMDLQEGALEERFTSDEGFRDAVLDLVRDGTAGIAGVRRESAATALIRKFVARQLAYRASQRGLFPTLSPGSTEPPGPKDWLVRMQEALPRVQWTKP